MKFMNKYGLCSDNLNKLISKSEEFYDYSSFFTTEDYWQISRDKQFPKHPFLVLSNHHFKYLNIDITIFHHTQDDNL